MSNGEGGIEVARQVHAYVIPFRDQKVDGKDHGQILGLIWLFDPRLQCQ